MPTPHPELDTVTEAVKRVVIAESRVSVDPRDVSDDEPLNGDLLQVNSFGFLGMLAQLEDDLDMEMPDDLFVGKQFRTVADLVGVVLNSKEQTA